MMPRAFTLTREHGCPHRQITLTAASELDLAAQIRANAPAEISHVCAEVMAAWCWTGREKAAYGQVWTLERA